MATCPSNVNTPERIHIPLKAKYVSRRAWGRFYFDLRQVDDRLEQTFSIYLRRDHNKIRTDQKVPGVWVKLYMEELKLPNEELIDSMVNLYLWKFERNPWERGTVWPLRSQD